MFIKYPKQVGFIINKFKNAGYEAYIVGGCVRDSLLKLEPKDWDITTNATPDQIKELFKGFTILPTGEKYGTITLLLYSKDKIDSYEITTFRADGVYSDGRRPESVTFGTNINEDLARRDFTINAMAYDRKLVDPFSGVKDLRNKLIKTVGNPNKRFDEDRLRILRGIRFVCKYNFRIERKTSRAMNRKYVDILEKISKERIHDELIKILEYADDRNYNQLHKLANLWNLIFNCEINICAEITLNKPVSYKLFKIFKRIGLDYLDIENWMKNFKFSNKEIKQVITLTKINNRFIELTRFDTPIDEDIIARYLLKDFSINDLNEYFRNELVCNAHWIDIINRNMDKCTHLNQLQINGNDLLKIHFDKNSIGSVLNRLLDLVILKPEMNCFCKLLDEALEIKENGWIKL